jgi:hypothetical protein
MACMCMRLYMNILQLFNIKYTIVYTSPESRSLSFAFCLLAVFELTFSACISERVFLMFSGNLLERGRRVVVSPACTRVAKML